MQKQFPQQNLNVPEGHSPRWDIWIKLYHCYVDYKATSDYNVSLNHLITWMPELSTKRDNDFSKYETKIHKYNIRSCFNYY